MAGATAGRRDERQGVNPWALTVLIAAVMASAVAVVYAKHRSRLLFVELQSLQKARDAMNVDWERLQLEQSTWTTHGRIENIARTQLNMTSPQSSSITVVRP